MALPLWHHVSLRARPTVGGVDPPIPPFRVYHRFSYVRCWTPPPLGSEMLLGVGLVLLYLGTLSPRFFLLFCALRPSCRMTHEAPLF